MNGGEGRAAGPTLSPCIRVCRMDADDRWCLGCARTRAEIAGWWLMSERDQRAVLAALPGRPRATIATDPVDTSRTRPGS
ncbi:MAG: DUF1289 domain-containing protein [Planctomycetota bacterium]